MFFLHLFGPRTKNVALAYFNVQDLFPAVADGATDVRTPPTEFRLLAAGVNTYLQEGMEEPKSFVFDDDSAAEVMRRFAVAGRDRLAVDYDHATYSDTKDAAPAAGWFVPQIRNGELWATDLKWTPRGAGYLKNAEYRFFSPTLEIDNDGHVEALRPIALTNDPALTNLRPLVAASRTHHKAPTMKLVLSSLGLAADADEQRIAAAIESLKTEKAQLLSLSGKSTVAEAIGAITALKAQAEQAITLSAEVTTLRAEKLSTEVNSLLDEASRDGRVPPAKREEMLKLSADHGPAALRACLSMLPKQPAQQAAHIEPKQEQQTGNSAAGMSTEQLSILSKLGTTPETFQKFSVAHRARLSGTSAE